MEQDTLWMMNKAALTGKLTRLKRSIATALAIVLVAYVLSVGIALLGSGSLLLVALPLLFLVAGTVYLYRMNNDLRSLPVTDRWIFTLALAATLLLLFSFFSVWKSQFSWLMVFAGPSAFVLPFVLLEMYRLYAEISYADAKSWYPSYELTTTFPDIYVNGFPVCFKIIQGEGSRDMLSIDFLPSVRMKPGEILVDIAQKQKRQGEKEILLANAAGEPYHWIFLTREKWLWSRALDPALTLSQNKIKYGNVIYALRVKENAVD